MAAIAAPVSTGANGDPFDDFRAKFLAKPCPPERIANPDQVKPMRAEDGLLIWTAGTALADDGTVPEAPLITPEQDAAKSLWAIEAAQVPYAPENCAFGKTLASGVIKHSNLTGGGAAHCAGEIILLSGDTIIVNGCSGRYGPQSGDEMSAVAKAFRASGYYVWSMGFDPDTARALPFIGVTPIWVP